MIEETHLQTQFNIFCLFFFARESLDEIQLLIRRCREKEIVFPPSKQNERSPPLRTNYP